MDEYNFQEYEYQRQVRQEAQRRADEKLSSVAYRVGRFCIRTSRVLAGIALAVAALLVLDGKRDISEVPFASLTIDMLVRNVGSWILGLGLIWWAFIAAFGASPKRQDLVKSFEPAAEQAVRAARDRARMNT